MGSFLDGKEAEEVLESEEKKMIKRKEESLAPF